MTIVAEGIGRTRLLPERCRKYLKRIRNCVPYRSEGSQIRSVRPTAPRRERQEATVAIGPSELQADRGSEADLNLCPSTWSMFLSKLYLHRTHLPSGVHRRRETTVSIARKIAPSLLYNPSLMAFSLGGIVTSVLRIAIIILCLCFALIELLALWMAIRLSRTITTLRGADLYEGDRHIDSGDLDYRIGVKRNDQLAELSRSFNKMAGSLERLLAEQKRKERACR